MNESLAYKDKDKNTVNFPDTVTCETEINPEPCVPPVSVTLENCEDAAHVDLGDVFFESLGRVLQFDIKLKNVCPGKRAAVAIVLTETDQKGKEFPRGLKTVLIPAHSGTACRDICLKCIKFILPESLETADTSSASLCRKRNFKVRTFANYIDTDLICCDTPKILS